MLRLASVRAYTRGIQMNNGGNASARLKGQDLMLIKRSKISFIDSTNSDFVIADFDGNLVEGDGAPSRESVLHGYLYRKFPDVGGIMHTHSTYSISWAEKDVDCLPRIAHHAELKISSDIPILRVKNAAVAREDFSLLDAALEKDAELRAFILEKHGIVAMGADVIQAEHMAELVEECAQIAILRSLLL